MEDIVYSSNDYTWDEVHKKADEIIDELIKEKFSGQDIIHIGETIRLAGNFVHARNMQSWMRNYDEQPPTKKEED